MRAMKPFVLATVAFVATAVAGCSSPRADEKMGFFVTSLDELGESPSSWHDMMTGSNPDGTLASGDVTCGN